MTDLPDPPPQGSPSLPGLTVEKPRRPFWMRISPLWLVPVLALAMSLGIAWKSYVDRGELIQITFEDGAGLVAGQSVLKFRQVTVGKVESVGFTDDLTRVLVAVRIDKNVAKYIGTEAKFWIVRPQIGFSGISGLDTVLSGVFIEGYWTGDYRTSIPGTFTGLEKPPIEENPDSGRWVTLTARDGGALIEGAPVIFRGIKVGQLRDLRLSEDGKNVLISAFVRAPYDQQLTSQTSFWDTSGFSVSLGASGVKLDVRSVSSLVQGGVEFGNLVSGTDAIQTDHVYQLYASEAAARDGIFTDNGSSATFSILLDGSVRGLKLGDPVNFRSVKVGEVTNIMIQIDPTPGGEREVRQRVDLELQASRMGLPSGATAADILDLLQNGVAHNLRARVSSAGLLRGSLEVELVSVPAASPATINTSAKPYPVLPTVAPDIKDVSVAAEGLFARINALPIEKVVDSTVTLLDRINNIVGQEDMQTLPQQIAGVVSDVREVVGSPELKAVPKTLNEGLTGAKTFIDDLNGKDAVNSVVSTMTDAADAARKVSDAASGLPSLIDTYQQLGEHVNGLPLDDVARKAGDLIASLNTLVASPKMQDLPRSLTGALDQTTAVLDELRQGGAVAKLNDTLGSAQNAAKDVSTAAGQLPDLVARLNKATDSINSALAAYGSNSAFNAETLAMLRQIREAAKAVEAFSRTLQRNPQSLILGR